MSEEEQFVCRTFLPISRHEKCHCPALDLNLLIEYNSDLYKSELVRTVASNDISGINRFIEDQGRIKVVDKYGNSPLHLAVILNKLEIVEHILNMKNYNVNAVNRNGQTSLHFAVFNNLEDIIVKLIKSGCDVNMGDESWCTPLHIAATRLFPHLIDTLLDHDADINAQNLLGKTALYHACEYGPLENVYRLLCHGASADIPDIYGVLPLTAAMGVSYNKIQEEIPDEFLEAHEILFNYTFGRDRICVNMSILTMAMKVDSPLFCQILHKVDTIKYSRQDLRDLAHIAMFIHWDYFKMFTRRFFYVVKDMVQEPCELHHFTSFSNIPTNIEENLDKLMEFLAALFRFRPSLNFLRGSKKFSYFIAVLVDFYTDKKITMKKLIEITIFLYSYGLPCELNHFLIIYEKLGFCELAQQLLEFDVKYSIRKPKSVMPYLIFDVNLSIDKFIDRVVKPRREYKAALKFFATPKVRRFFAKSKGGRKYLRRVPQVPKLLELARNQAREHIVTVCNIQKTKDFYKCIERIPINNIYKQILNYQKPLYNI